MRAPSICGSSQSALHCAQCEVRPLSVCSALEPEDLRALERLGKSVCFPSKATVFAQGDPANAVYTIVSGVARLCKLLPDGRRQIIGFALPGDFIGLTGAAENGFSLDAVGPLVMCRFPRDDFAALAGRKPDLLWRLHTFAMHELALARDQMVLLGRRTADERIVAFLLGMRDRWAKVDRPSATIPLPMGRQDIAGYLGMTIETASRTLNKLAKAKSILIVPDGVRVLDLPRLQARMAA